MLKTVSRHLFPFHTQPYFCASLQRKIFAIIVMTHCFPFLTSQYLLRPVQSYLLSPSLHWNGFDQGSQCQSQEPLLPPMRAISSIWCEWLPPPPGSTLFPEPPRCHISLAVPLLMLLCVQLPSWLLVSTSLKLLLGCPRIPFLTF